MPITLSPGFSSARKAAMLALAPECDSTLVATTLELRGEPDPQDLVGQPLGDDARADRQHIGVVVPPRVLRGVEVVAERGAHAVHLVGGDLLALATSAQHDAALGAAS